MGSLRVEPSKPGRRAGEGAERVEGDHEKGRRAGRIERGFERALDEVEVYSSEKKMKSYPSISQFFLEINGKEKAEEDDRDAS